MQGTGGVAVGVGVGSGGAVGVGTTVGATVAVAVGGLLVVGVDEPHAASRPTAAASTVETRTGRIATQGTRNLRSTRVTCESGCPGPPAARERKDRRPMRRAPQWSRCSNGR